MNVIVLAAADPGGGLFGNLGSGESLGSIADRF